MPILQSLFGLVAFSGLAWILSERRNTAALRVAAIGIGLQIIIAAVLLRIPAAQFIFIGLNAGILAIENASLAGTSFVFGYLGGSALPFEATGAGGTLIFAFRSLPLIMLVSALTALLSHWKILPQLVRAFSFVLQRTLRVGGAVALSAAANVFVGMVEAPLFVRPYLARLSRGELFMVMCTGMATIAGTVLFVYTSILNEVMPDAAGHLVTASIISAPAAIAIAWIMIPPETDTDGTAELDEDPFPAASAMDAITQGTQRGLSLYLNIVAMLIVLVALVQLVNIVVGYLPQVGGTDITLQRALGWCMSPIAWLMGIPWAEAANAGGLLGIKTVLNEFLAYTELAALAEAGMSPRTTLIMSYALCGMANFGSVGIMIGGFSALIPERRAEITELALKSVIGGTIATCCTGAVVGIIAV